MTGRKSEATAIERNLADLKEAKAMDVQTNSSNDRDLSSSPEDTRGFQGAEGAAGGRRRSSVLDMVKGWAGRSSS